MSESLVPSLSVACPVCNAAPGVPCSLGANGTDASHLARVDAAHAERAASKPRVTNFGPWAEWIETIPKQEKLLVFALAERILPALCKPDHTRYDHLDDAAISTALRIAQRFYARIGTFGGAPLKPSKSPKPVRKK